MKLFPQPEPTESLFRLFPQFRPEWGFGPQARWFELMARSRKYRLFIATAPRTGTDQVIASDSVEHDFVVPVGSLIWGVSSSSGLSAGFRFQIWNDDRLVVPRMNAANLAGTPANTTFSVAGPYLLAPPFAIQGTGLVHIRIVNLGTATNGIQVAIFMAIPIGGSA